MTFQDIRRDLCAFVIGEGAQGNLDIPVEAISAASKALGALETIRAEVAEIEAAARAREDFDVEFTAGIIAGVVRREIAKVEGKT